MIKVRRYDKSLLLTWNDFVAKSKQGTFLFDRNYMDYHSDRFNDHSLMFYMNEELFAMLPANLKGDILYSHQGLSYGGLITNEKMRSIKALEVFESLIQHLRSKNIKNLFYKATPHIYHKKPSEEDLYALFRSGAKLYRRDLSTIILVNNEFIKFERGKRRSIDKAIKFGLQIIETDDFNAMHEIIRDVLMKKYQTSPVHTAEEMALLNSRFPSNIRLFGCYNGNKMISGALIYIANNVAHAQYVYSSDEGKNLGANDLMYHYLINDKFNHMKYFSFGISTEQDGFYLNEKLNQSKEEFTGRAVCYDHYELKIL